jgi:monofunctional biosynthetic peptidoglycan transglycosylase
MAQNRYLLAAAALVGLAWFMALSSTFSTPPVAQLILLDPGMTAYMRADPHQPIRRQWRPLGEISPHLQEAVVMAEDDQFFSHPGFDIEAIRKAIKVNIRRKRFAHGASTITQQVARNIYLTPEKSLLRKFRELLIALKLERTLSKRRILEIYLNIAEWGQGIYGAEAAAQHYFGKGARWLTPGESAYLASILPRPRYYDRHRSSKVQPGRAAELERRL